MRGKLIVLEGTDGCGKGTQTQLLIEYLKKQGLDVEKLDFPNYKSPGAYFVEQYLNGEYGSAKEVSAKKASLFFALDRFDKRKEITKSLEQGKILISNRYVSSNAGHQGGKIRDPKERQNLLDWLYDLEYEILELPKPDFQIYLHIPYDIAQKLVDNKSEKEREYAKGKKRDIHEEDKEHLKNAEESYNYLVENESNWEKVECMKDDTLLSVEEIHQKIIHLSPIEKIVAEFSAISE